MGRYAFVLVSMYRYSLLITFELFRNFFGDRGVGGWGVSYQKSWDCYIFFYIYKAPNSGSRSVRANGESSKPTVSEVIVIQ